MSIATKRGDTGQTGLPGGLRVSKSDHRVDAYGTIDELISSMGFARAICPDEDLRVLTKELQRELFKDARPTSGCGAQSRLRSFEQYRYSQSH